MKRVVLILICLLLAAAAFGCAPGNEGSASFDKGGSNLEENAFFNSYLAARMGDFVYFTEEMPAKGGHKIYVYDSVSGVVFPLCAKPECTHDSGSCGAAYPTAFGNLNFMPYGDRLYFIGDAENIDGQLYMRVYSVAQDGTDRRLETKYEYSRNDGFTLYAGIYDGTLYRMCSNDEVENTVTYTAAAVYSVPLGDNGAQKELFRTRSKDGLFIGTMQAGRLWFAMYDGDGNCSMHLYSYDMDTGKVSVEFEGKAPGYAYSMAALDDKLVFCDGTSAFYYSYDDGTFSELASEDGFIRYGGSVIFAWTSWFDYVCMSEDGSVLHQGTLDSSLFKEEKPYKTYLGSINGQFLYLVDGSNEEGAAHNYFLVYDSETDTFSIPWDSEGMYP